MIEDLHAVGLDEGTDTVDKQKQGAMETAVSSALEVLKLGSVHLDVQADAKRLLIAYFRAEHDKAYGGGAK